MRLRLVRIPSGINRWGFFGGSASISLDQLRLVSKRFHKEFMGGWVISRGPFSREEGERTLVEIFLTVSLVPLRMLVVSHIIAPLVICKIVTHL